MHEGQGFHISEAGKEPRDKVSVGKRDGVEDHGGQPEGLTAELGRASSISGKKPSTSRIKARER